MARPIWTGTLSFGLLNVPVSLMPGERKVDLQFRMLDSRDRKPIRFERVTDYHGEFRARLQKIVTRRIKAKGGTARVEEPDEPVEDASTNVVDFMALLQKSLDARKRTPAKKSAAAGTAKKATRTAAKTAARKTRKKAAGKSTNKAASKTAKSTSASSGSASHTTASRSRTAVKKTAAQRKAG